MLVGIPAIAVDRHIRAFVQQSGFKSHNYTAIRKVVEDAADQLNMHRTDLDYAIWLHVSQKINLQTQLPNMQTDFNVTQKQSPLR